MRRFLLYILLSVLAAAAFASNWKDETTDYIPKSPEAAAYDRVTDVPVSMYTGRADFSIPLYTVTSGDISLPVSLDYEGTAVRVEQEATWVGLNWRLDAGGCITVNSVAGHSNRSSSSTDATDYDSDWKHLFEEMSLNMTYASGGEFKIPYKFDGMHPARGRYGRNWFSGQTTEASDMSARLYDEILNYHNGECPTYHAVFCGNSITLVWDPFKREFFQTGLRKNFRIEGNPGGEITLTDGNGVEYHFRFMEKVFAAGSDADMDHFTYDGTYFLTSIESPTGHTILLTYAQEGAYYPVRHVSERLYGRNFPYSILSAAYAEGANATQNALPSTVTGNLSLLRTLSPYLAVGKYRLRSISADGLTVTFNANTARKDLNCGSGAGDKARACRLDNIEITRQENGKALLMRKFILDYSYFQKSETGGNTLKDYWKKMATATDVYAQYYPDDSFMYLRLRLDKLTEYGSDGSSKPPYRFSYYDGLPCKNSASQDYWGYYNGCENLNGIATKEDQYVRSSWYHTLLPRHYTDTDDGMEGDSLLSEYLNVHGADRRSNSRYATAGMLSGVTFPAGGQLSFNYRQNTFCNYYYESADTAEAVSGYFSKAVTVYNPVTSKTLEVKSSDHEKWEPKEQRGISSCRFTLYGFSKVTWKTTFVKNSLGRNDSYWRLMQSHRAILTKTTKEKDGSETDSLISTESLASADTASNKAQVSYSADLYLASGDYCLSIDPLPEDNPDDDYRMITSLLTSGTANISYYKKAEEPVTHYTEPTLGTSTSISYRARESVAAYECNQAGYCIPDEQRGSQFFLVEKPQSITFSVSYAKADYPKEPHWTDMIGSTVLLLKYDIGSGFYTDYEYVAESKAISLTPSDTTRNTGSVSKSIRMTLQPGRYEITLPSIPSYDGKFYEIQASVSLNGSRNKPVASYGNGVCVSSVVRKDEEGNTVGKTSYYYTKNDLGDMSGRLSSPVVFDRRKMLVFQGDTTSLSNTTAKEILYNCVSSCSQCANSSFTGYGRVTRSIYDAGRKVNTRTMTFWNRNWASGDMWYYVPVQEDPRNGLVLTDSLYGSDGRLAAADNYTYKISNTENRLINASVENIYYGPGGGNSSVYNKWADLAGGGIMDICLYPHSQFSVLSRSAKSSTVSKGGVLSKNTGTTFNRDNGLPSIETADASGKDETVITQYLYPTDYTGIDMTDALVKSHINALPVQVSTFDDRGGTALLTGSSVVKYNALGQPVACYTRDINSPVSRSSFEDTGKNAFDLTGYSPRLTVDYDSCHNPVGFTDAGGMTTSLAWGYDGLYPTAVSRGGITTEYGFIPHVGMSSMTMPNGNSWQYSYDSFQRLSTVTGTDGVADSYTYHYGRNYMLHVRNLDPSGNGHITSVQYFDGLGRPTLSATDGEGGNGKGIYAMSVYDGLDRPARQYLPFAVSSGTDYIEPEDVPQRSSAAYGDSYAYSDIAYDALDRETSVTVAGAEWHDAGKRNEREYLLNGKNDVRLYEAHLGSDALKTAGHYEPCTLQGERHTDADGHTVTVYTDLLGRKVLERRTGDDGNNDTYFVYNELGQLRFVLPPQYQNDNDLLKYGYEYRYDGRGNVVWKRLPGCEPVRMWYDKADRLKALQDRNLRTKGLYRFFLYDGLSRVAVTGTCLSCDLDTTVATATLNASQTGMLGTGYATDHDAGLAGAVLESAAYYDGYDFRRIPLFKDNMALKKTQLPSAASAKGNITAKLTTATDGKPMLDIFYYDIKGRVIDKLSTMPDGALLDTKTSYTFSGNVCRTEEILYKGGKTYRAVTENTFNPHNDRQATSDITVDAGQSHRVSSLEYDDLGRTKTLSQGGNALSTVYGYNIQGWLKDISNTEFEEHLTYNESNVGTRHYNGDISTQQWKTANDNVMRGYKFAYDKLDRLTSASYGEGASFTANRGRYDESQTFNANGAINGIVRNGLLQNGSYGAIDSLDITLDGNRLQRVDDKAAPVVRDGSFDFVDDMVKTGGAEYVYDDNGNLKQDANRGITDIEYDNNGNPILIQFSDGSQTEYVYTADGDKLRTVHRTATPNINVGLGQARQLSANEILSEDSTDYIGNFVFENGIVDKYLFTGGYYTYNDTGKGKTRFHYYVTDHLGNNRMVVNEDGTVEQVTHYYPFGTPFSDTGLNPDFQKYKYSGKELDRIHGLDTYDYGARQNFSVLGVWDRVDPLTEKYYNISPYAVCGNNPIRLIDHKGLFPIESEAIEYAVGHNVSYDNIHYANDRKEWYVAFGEDGKGYKSGGTMYRRFHEKLSESRLWKDISMVNTDLSTGTGFIGWGLANSLERCNAYAFIDGSGQYINSAKPTFRLRNIDVDFSLRNANKIASGIRYFGNISIAVSSCMTLVEMVQEQKNLIGEGGLDLIMTGVGVIPEYGWIISSAYFLGKSALEDKDLDFWNK